MHFGQEIISVTKGKKTSMFVDMDGVITDYNFGKKLDFLNKRPLNTNIRTLEKISKLPNINLYILSICREEKEIDYKNQWLDKYAPYFKKDNRIIIPRDKHTDLKSKEIKELYLRETIIKMEDQIIIVIDDDNEILKYLKSKFNNIVFYQDSSLID